MEKHVMKSALLLVLTFICTFGQAQKYRLPDNVSEVIRARVEAGVYPGVAVGVIDANGAVFFNFGKTGDKGTPVSEHSIFEIGSITKTFTAIMLADLDVRNVLSVDDPVSKHLQTVRLPERNGAVITLGHLSDHTSGLPRMPDNMTPADPLNPYADYSVEQMYAFLEGHTLTRDIGSAYEYSNLAQGFLGHVLEEHEKMSYAELLRKVITGPLKMDETGISFTAEMKKNLALPHSQGLQVSNWDLNTLAGAGAIRSSTSDMLKYLAANLGLTSTSLKAAMELSHQQRHAKSGSRVGLGWHIAEGSGGDIIWHNGGTGGYRAFAGFVKELNRGVVILANSDTGVDDLGYYLLGGSKEFGAVKPHIAREMRRHIDKHGPAGLEKAYAEWKNAKADAFEFSETDINALGYHYIATKNYDAALAVFHVNVIEYPESSNVWDSYGEALMLKGDTAAAIVNYQKSVDMNPGNTNGIMMLEKMGVKVATVDVRVENAVLDTYLGTYDLFPGFSIVITRKDNQLFGQATGQAPFEMFPKSETEFFLKVVDAKVRFNKDDLGNVISMTLVQNGQVMEGKKTK